MDTFILNEIEGALLAGMPEEQDGDAIFDALRSRYPQAQIILTLGSRGVTAWLGGQRYDQPCFTVRAVDTTGAGDSFSGALLYSMAEDIPVDAAVKLAARCAAKTVTIQGPHGFWKLED